MARPFHQMILGASVMGIADGPTEVHKVTVARHRLVYRPPMRYARVTLTTPAR
jgi:acyl-CoA dehydrogenase